MNLQPINPLKAKTHDQTTAMGILREISLRADIAITAIDEGRLGDDGAQGDMDNIQGMVDELAVMLTGGPL